MALLAVEILACVVGWRKFGANLYLVEKVLHKDICRDNKEVDPFSS